MSARSRSVSSGSLVSPAAQNVPYSVPSDSRTGTVTKLRMRGRRAAGRAIAAGNALRSGMTGGRSPSRTAWHRLDSCFTFAPSANSSGIEESTTSRCWVVPSMRVRKVADIFSDVFAVRSSSAICWSTSERCLPMRVPSASRDRVLQPAARSRSAFTVRQLRAVASTPTFSRSRPLLRPAPSA